MSRSVSEESPPRNFPKILLWLMALAFIANIAMQFARGVLGEPLAVRLHLAVAIILVVLLIVAALRIQHGAAPIDAATSLQSHTKPIRNALITAAMAGLIWGLCLSTAFESDKHQILFNVSLGASLTFAAYCSALAALGRRAGRTDGDSSH